MIETHTTKITRSKHFETLLVKISKNGYPETAEFADNPFVLVENQHITILYWSKTLKEQARKDEQINEAIISLLKEFDFTYELTGIFYHVKKEGKESIVQMVNSNIEEFYNRLNAVAGLSLTPPPTHITVYVRKYQHEGIKIEDDEEFSHIARRIESLRVN